MKCWQKWEDTQISLLKRTKKKLKKKTIKLKPIQWLTANQIKYSKLGMRQENDRQDKVILNRSLKWLENKWGDWRKNWGKDFRTVIKYLESLGRTQQQLVTRYEARPLTLLPHKHSCLATQPLLLRSQEFVSLRLNSTAESFKTVFKKKKVLYILGITCVISCSTGHYFVLNIWPKKGHTAKPENCTIFLLVFCSTFHPHYKANVSRSVHFKVSCTEVYSFSTIFLR